MVNCWVVYDHIPSKLVCAYLLRPLSENLVVSVGRLIIVMFVYDGNGNRVKATIGGTTVYIGNYFEWTGSTGTMNVKSRYYYAGTTRIAMRTGSSTLNYLLGDHLGSQAITTNNSGTRTGEIRYYPWGTERYTYGTTPTTYHFTGQRLESSLGLYYYGARWYDPAVGRFVSADTVIPGGVQGLDRYAYVNNNPLRYIDPNGNHPYCSSKYADPEDCYKIEENLPFSEDEYYDPESDSIPSWSNDQSDALRIERSEKVWGWLCSSGGWWGSGCPDEKALAAWLLEHEGGELTNGDIVIKPEGETGLQIRLTLLHTFFKDGNITKEELAQFTAFFNPKMGSNGAFTLGDWEMLNTKPDDAVIQRVNDYWENPAPYYGENGELLTKWWDYTEDFNYQKVYIVHDVNNSDYMYFGY